MHLPGWLIQPLQALLRELDDTSGITSVGAVSGGCISHVTRLQTGKRVYLLKWQEQAPPGFFAAEVDGLARLAASGAVRVPAVWGWRVVEDVSRGALLLLEWLEGSPPHSMARLGEQLAALHRSSLSPHEPPAYGLAQDNYLGSTAQTNGWATDWVDFFTHQRLGVQMALVERDGLLPAKRRQSLEKLISRLPELLGGVTRQPALIHGDLWSGNVIPCGEELAIIDPAVSFSDREAEMAYTELFGGFDAHFYAAYQSALPLEAGYAERRGLYQLYHLLNHLHLFGKEYGPAVDAVLRRYTA